MKVKQGSAIAVVVIGIIIAVVVLYQNNEEHQDNQHHMDNYAEIMDVVEEYMLENLSNAYRESLDERTLTVEPILEAEDDYISAIYWEVQEEERTLEEDDYLVFMSSKDERNRVRLVIDTDTMTVIGHIPSV